MVLEHFRIYMHVISRKDLITLFCRKLIKPITDTSVRGQLTAVIITRPIKQYV